MAENRQKKSPLSADIKDATDFDPQANQNCDESLPLIVTPDTEVIGLGDEPPTLMSPKPRSPTDYAIRQVIKLAKSTMPGEKPALVWQVQRGHSFPAIRLEVDKADQFTGHDPCRRPVRISAERALDALADYVNASGELQIPDVHPDRDHTRRGTLMISKDTLSLFISPAGKSTEAFERLQETLREEGIMQKPDKLWREKITKNQKKQQERKL